MGNFPLPAIRFAPNVVVARAALFDDDQLDASDLPRIVEAKRRILAGAGLLEAVPVSRAGSPDLSSYPY